MVADRPLEVGPWHRQGLPLYAGRVAYAQTFEVEKAGRHVVRLPSWWGPVAEVAVDGHPAGVIDAQPYELDLGPAIAPGRHRVEVIIHGTLKNLLGPFHAGPVRGLASPHNMAQAPKTGLPPGEAYDTSACGLFEPFVVERFDDR